MAKLTEPVEAPAAAMTKPIHETESLETGTTTPRSDIMRTKPRDPSRPSADAEAVRRNLLRQNRNLARSHSAQSLQIRTLGAEVSRLLAANLALKEEVIRLKDARPYDGFAEMREMLRSKVQDLAAILDQPVARAQSQISPERRKSACLEGMEFRERAPLKDLMFDARMPAISEEQHSVDLLRLSDATSTSSLLGTPPTSRDDVVESIEINHEARSEDAPVLVNIEARKKRKEPNTARRRSSLIAPMPDGEDVLRGAKRKLADREKENAQPVKRIDSEHDIPFDSVKPFVVEDKKPTNRRAALSEKSVNMSPRKSRTEEKPCKPTKRRSVYKEEMKLSIINEPQPEILSQAAVDEMSLPPKTPGDILSPASSDGWPADGKADTPPPPGLSMSTTDTRPSRRARAAVNYAEPSLVAKMRRPSKQMVDAISGLHDPRNVMTTSRRVSRVVEETTPDIVTESPLSEKEEKPDKMTSISLSTLMAKQKDVKKQDNDLSIFDFQDRSSASPENDPEFRPAKSRRHSTKPTARTDIPRRHSKPADRRKSMMV